MPDTKPLLMIPGPTTVPETVRQAIARPSIYHRGAQFAELLSECNAGLQTLLGTTCPVAVLAASGTGATEAAVANLLSPGDRILVINTGKFGARMGQIASRYGIGVTWWQCHPGQTADPDLLARFLHQVPFQALGIVYNETSTGVQQDLTRLGQVAADAGVLAIVDAVSIVGGAPIDMDENRLDAVIGASQKALMLPPGLSFVALSEQGQARAEACTNPSYYFDLPKALQALERGQTPYTPPVNLICGLREALHLIEQEGMEQVFTRHRALAHACRAAIRAMGLKLVPTDDAHASATVTAAWMPQNLDSSELVKRVLHSSSILISGGQDELKGRIFRIAHMGSCSVEDLTRTVSAVASALSDMDMPTEPIRAETAAVQAYREAIGQES